MRVLPGVRTADFDVPTETFTVSLTAEGKPGPVLDAIRGLGYTPALLAGPPGKPRALERIENPASLAIREALARTLARGVRLVVDFGGPFCRLCKHFDETTLRDPLVKERLARLEFLQVDVEADPAAVKDFGVKGVPDLWFLAPDGRVLGRENRYLTTEEFLAALDKHIPR